MVEGLPNNYYLSYLKEKKRNRQLQIHGYSSAEANTRQRTDQTTLTHGRGVILNMVRLPK